MVEFGFKKLVGAKLREGKLKPTQLAETDRVII
jgi:hypothetical protein